LLTMMPLKSYVEFKTAYYMLVYHSFHVDMCFLYIYHVNCQIVKRPKIRNHSIQSNHSTKKFKGAKNGGKHMNGQDRTNYKYKERRR